MKKKLIRKLIRKLKGDGVPFLARVQIAKGIVRHNVNAVVATAQEYPTLFSVHQVQHCEVCEPTVKVLLVSNHEIIYSR